MPLHAKLFLALGALSAAASVVLGAAAAHMANLQVGTTLPLFQTALQYHQFHALGLLIVGLVASNHPSSRWFLAAGILMIVGTLLFSGNLYLRSIAGFNDWHAVTPYGGAAYIGSWLLLAIGALRLGKHRG
ncbi:MAG: DUF423 domain-containing protein [Rhodocyclales bacterium]|nr:DUF423 domain-containing protein [Rhodocyclales bacterium]